MIHLPEDIHFDVLDDLAYRISNSQDLPRSLDAEVAVALNIKAGKFRSFRILKHSNSLEDIGKHCSELPEFIHSIDDAKTLFVKILGELENPFVYTLVTDYAELRQCRISDSQSVFVSCDAKEEAAALTAAVLKTISEINLRMECETLDNKSSSLSESVTRIKEVSETLRSRGMIDIADTLAAEAISIDRHKTINK